MIKVLDLYCGMGGLSLGFLLALEDAETLGLDIDKCAVTTYNHNLNRLGGRAVRMDILRWKPWGKWDIIIGGVPCQPFSAATSKEMAGERHPLFPTLPRFFDIVLALRPKVFLMENVKGLTFRPHKRYLKAQLARVGEEYVVTWKVLNSAYYGVPQRRERLFVLGIRRDLGVLPSFPWPSHHSHVMYTIDGGLRHKWVILTEALMGLEGNGRVARRLDIGKKCRLDRPAPTIIANESSGLSFHALLLPMDSGRYRRVTIREALRIQSFPDWWSFPPWLSRSSRLRLIGEAVPPILAYRLAIHLARAIGWETRVPPREEDWALPYFHRAFIDLLGETSLQKHDTYVKKQ